MLDPEGNRNGPADRRRRRRQWGADGSLPPDLRVCYTEAQRAVLAVIASEAMTAELCKLSVGAIAEHAGVSASSVHAALRLARRLGHLQSQG